MSEKKSTGREGRLKRDLAEALRRLGLAQKRVADLERDNALLRRRIEQERPVSPPPYPETLPWETEPWPPARPYYGRPLSNRGRHF